MNHTALTSLIGIMSSETVLKDYISLIGDKYDYILVDCSPNLGQLTLNALVAADEVIIPVQAAYLPIKGLEQLLKTISRVKRKMNPKLHIMGILLTMVDYRTNYASEITDVLYNVYGASIHIFDTSIPMSVCLTVCLCRQEVDGLTKKTEFILSMQSRALWKTSTAAR